MKSRLKSIFPFIIISFVIISSVYFFGPTEIFFKNASSELPYNYIALFKHIALKSVIYTGLLSVLLYALSFIKIFNIGLRILPLACAIALILYMNAAFFKIAGVMDGTEHIDILSAESLINTSIMLMLILISLIFYKFINDKKLYKPICMILITANIVSVYFSVTSSSYKPRVEGAPGLSLEAKDIMRLSDKKNIVYIILDTFDGSYMDEILSDETDGKQYSDMFKDFTYFKNYAGVYYSTMPTGVTQFVGKTYNNDIPVYDFIKDALTSDESFFKISSETGWRNILYKDYYHWHAIYPLNSNILHNISFENRFTDIPSKLADETVDVSVYKHAPLMIKNSIRKGQSLLSPAWDLQYLDIISNNDFITDETPTFSLIHLWGSHPAYVMDENLNIAENATPISQSKASLKLTHKIIEKMKKANVYDNSLIIITADHGGEKLRSNPILLMKMPYEENGGGCA